MMKARRGEIVEVAGPLDDLRIAEIMGTGATVAELTEAKRWLAGYKRTIGDAEDLRPSVITKVCDILRGEEPEWFDG